MGFRVRENIMDHMLKQKREKHNNSCKQYLDKKKSSNMLFIPA